MSATLTDFLVWREKTRGTVALRLAYVDMLDGDHVAALVLAQILYWCLPDKDGKTKLRVLRKDRLWLVKDYHDFWKETRVSEKTLYRKLHLLEEKGLIDVEVHKFRRKRARHIAVNEQAVVDSWDGVRALPGGA